LSDDIQIKRVTRRIPQQREARHLIERCHDDDSIANGRSRKT
jgi:hypothetical protein